MPDLPKGFDPVQPTLPEGFEPVKAPLPEGFEPVAPAVSSEYQGGLDAAGVGFMPIPEAFKDRLRAGQDQHSKMERIVKAVGAGAVEGFGHEPLGIETGGKMDTDLQDVGIFNRPGETAPIRLLNEAVMRPAAAAADAAMRLIHAGIRGGAAGVAQLTGEVRGDAESQPNKITKDTNELDLAGQMALLVAGSGYQPPFVMSRTARGPNGVVDEPIGALPKPQDFSDTATVVAEGAPAKAVEGKLNTAWQEKGLHPAEVAADAERDPVIKQQLLSSTSDLPEAYGLAPHKYGTPDWQRWSQDAKDSVATRQLPNGDVVPAPEAVASYLKQFGDEAGFKFQVGPEGTDIFDKKAFPHFAMQEVTYPDGRRIKQGQVYIPDNADAIFRKWTGLGKNEILFHEVGHALDMFVFDGMQTLSDLKKTPGLMDEMITANKQFAPKLWSMSDAYRRTGPELMADSIAAYLSNPELRKQMPLFTERFGPALEKYKDIAERALPKKTDGVNWDMPPNENPGFKEQNGYNDPSGKVPVGGGGSGGGNGGVPGRPQGYYPPDPPPNTFQLAQKKILDRLSIGENTNGVPGYSIKKFYTDIVDKFFPISEARRGVELTAENDPYKLVRLYSGWTGKADHMLNEGTFDFHTFKNNGPSLSAILAPVEKDLNGFRAFAAAARAAELDSRGFEHGFDMAAVREVGQAGIAKYGPVMKKLVDYQNNVSAYLRDSGVISDVAYEAMLEANKLFVPFHRVMGDDVALGQKLGGANMTARNPIKTLEGSSREVIDPIESIVKNTYLLTSMAEKNTVGTKLIDMLINQRAHEAIEGRPPEMSAIPQITDQRGVDATKKWMGNNGGPDSEALARALNDAARPNAAGEISIFRDGTRFTYRVDADLANSMKGLDAQSIGLIEKLMAPMASTLRAGAILNPEFAARHTLRDFLYSFVKTTDGFYSPLDAARGLTGLIVKDSDYWQWMKSGGANSTLVSLDRRYLQESLDKLAGDTGIMTRAYNVVIDPQASWLQKGGAVLGTPFAAIGKYVVHPLQLTAELAMNMNHLGGFKRALRKAEADLPGPGTIMTLRDGVSPAQGIESATVSKGDLLNAGWQSRNTGIDIARTGAKMQGYNMISAFANAKVQDTFQIMEAMAKTPISTATRMAIGITIPSLALWYANKDDSRYKELPEWEKDVFWIVPTDTWEAAKPEDAAARPSDQVRMNNGQIEVNNGTLWRIPKPFSTGVMFGSGAERLADLLYNQNPDAFKGFFHSLRESTVGDLTPNAIVPSLEQSANRVQYTGRTLIPQQLEKGLPEYQYAPYTTELAKKLGQVVASFPGMREASVGHEGSYDNATARALSSPILIENYVRGWTGSLGTYALKTMDKAGRLIGALDDPPHAAATLADIPLVKAFVARYPSANAQSISDFYEGYERNAKYYASYKQRAAEGDEKAMAVIQEAGGDQMFSKLDGIKKAVGEHYSLIRSIDADPQMKPYEKRQLIDGLYYSMIKVGQQGTQVLKELGGH